MLRNFLKYLFVVFFIYTTPMHSVLAEVDSAFFSIELQSLNSNETLDDVFYYHEDESASQDLNQVLELTNEDWHKKDQGSLSFGYTDSAYWFRILLNNPTEEHQQRILELGYPVLDYIDVYQRSNGGDWQLTKLGDKYPFEERMLQHRFFLVPFEVNSQGSLELLFRVKTSSSLQFPAVIWQVEDFYAHDQTQMLVMGLYYGIMLVMVLYNFFIYFVVREKDYLYYVFFVGFLTLFVASLHGLSFQYLWPHATSWNDTSIVVFLAAAMLFGMLFTFNFLKLNNLYWLRQVRNSQAILLILIILSNIIVSYHYTIRFLIVVAVFTVILAIVLAIASWMRGHVAARYYMLAWTTMLAGGAILAMNKFNMIPRNSFTENVMQIGFALEVILLSLALADRLNQEKRQRLDAQIKALENEKLARQSHYEALEHERKANEVQTEALAMQKQATETLEQRVKERTEELEKANEKLELMSITDSLTNIRNRRYFDNNLKLEIARSIRSKEPISLLIIDIDYFKGVNDTFGHQAGDEVLKMIAASLDQSINRTTDLLARFGGEEFVVILPYTTQEGAVHLAESIRLKIEELDFDSAAAGLKITASIGVYGAVPTATSHYDTWVRNADDALYYAKNYGRNRVVSHATLEEKEK